MMVLTGTTGSSVEGALSGSLMLLTKVRKIVRRCRSVKALNLGSSTICQNKPHLGGSPRFQHMIHAILNAIHFSLPRGGVKEQRADQCSETLCNPLV